MKTLIWRLRFLFHFRRLTGAPLDDCWYVSSPEHFKDWAPTLAEIDPYDAAYEEATA